jgi:predicted lipid-binding transport protein (Tim44 family)
MKKFLISLMLLCSALTLVVSDADAARRLGGGGSIGRQSQNVTRSVPAQPTAPSQQVAPRPAAPAPAPIPPRPASPWRNILGGALLGLGLGALLSHFGLGGAMASVISTILTVLLLGFVLMFILRLFRRKNEADGPVPAYAGGYARSSTPEIGSGLQSSVPASYGSASAPAAPWGVPADFDVPAFLRNAKSYFIRLQAAWDKADVNDIREFTTPEMFAELRLQIQERGPSQNNTDVVQLNADLLGIETSERDYLASVKFHGLIKEAPEESAAEFAEVWNLSKPLSGQGGWVLAGIQQLS